MIQGRHNVQVCVCRLLSAGIVMISHRKHIRMFLDHLEKFKFPVLVSSVLKDSLDCHNLVCVEVGARVDNTKGTVRNHLVKSVLLPSLLL